MTTYNSASEAGASAMKPTDPHERVAMNSDDAFRRWEEELEGQVAAALNGHTPTDDLTPEVSNEEILAELPDEEDTSAENQSHGDYAYIGKLVTDPRADPVEIYKVCRDLKGTLEADILYVDHSTVGTTITCTVPDPASLLKLMNILPRISAWSFAAR